VKDIAVTSIRIPKEMHEKIKQEALEVGASYNSHVMELIYLGMKFRNSEICVIQPKELQAINSKESSNSSISKSIKHSVIDAMKCVMDKNE